MQTVTELLSMLRDSVTLLVRRFPQLLFWFCLGSAVHEGGLIASTLLGARHAVLATSVFLAGVIGYAASLVIMVHSVEPALPTLSGVRPGSTSEPTSASVPALVFRRESHAAVLALALSPFLAVYTLWGLADQEVYRLFTTNIVIHGLGGVTNWSVNLTNNLNLYLVIAAVAWVVKQVGTWIGRWRAQLPGRGIVVTLADAVFTFTAFMALLRLTARVVGWLTTRAVWVGLVEGWNAFLAWLPDLVLPFGLTVPEALRHVAAWLTQDLLPGLAANAVLPLMWLALAAIVLGWREFSAEQVLSGTALEHRYRGWRRVGSVDGPLGRVVGWVTGDIRTKYLPLAQALRLVLRAGPRFLGAYLVAAATIRLLEAGFERVLVLIVGPRPTVDFLALQPGIDLITGAVFTCWAIALYAMAFDRGVAEVVGRPISATGTGSPPGAESVPDARADR